MRPAWVVKGGGEVEPGEHSEAAQLAHPHVARTCVRLSVSRTTSHQVAGGAGQGRREAQPNSTLHCTPPLSAATRTTPPHTTILVRVVHTRGTLGTRGGGAPNTAAGDSGDVAWRSLRSSEELCAEI